MFWNEKLSKLFGDGHNDERLTKDWNSKLTPEESKPHGRNVDMINRQKESSTETSIAQRIFNAPRTTFEPRPEARFYLPTLFFFDN